MLGLRHTREFLSFPPWLAVDVLLLHTFKEPADLAAH